MAEKSGKKKTKKAAKADTGVLGNLSPTRPTRLGGDRREAGTRAPRATSRPAAASAAKTAAKPPAAPPKGWQTPDQDGGKGGPDIVTTAVQAAGEIAQLGVTVGGQLLKRAAGRIPRP
jgi:hypothetical protein